MIKIALNNPLVKLSLALGIFVGIFLGYLILKLFSIIGITILLALMGIMFKTKYKFKDYFKVACYVITLPVITEIIAIIVAGGINEYATITYYLLIYVYVYYAIRALKLDDIIMSTQQKIFGMKMNNDSDTNQTDSSEERKDENDDKSKDETNDNNDEKNK